MSFEIEPLSGFGIADPAAVHCVEQGGKNDQSGDCIFPNGTRCEHWAFFRGECKPGGDWFTPIAWVGAGLAVLKLFSGRR